MILLSSPLFYFILRSIITILCQKRTKTKFDFDTFFVTFPLPVDAEEITSPKPVSKTVVYDT